jgi:hypothetical protein
MNIKCIYKISEDKEKNCSVNYDNIVRKIGAVAWEINREKSDVLIQVLLKNEKDVYELKRRLGGKRSRNVKKVEIVKFELEANK